MFFFLSAVQPHHENKTKESNPVVQTSDKWFYRKTVGMWLQLASDWMWQKSNGGLCCCCKQSWQHLTCVLPPHVCHVSPTLHQLYDPSFKMPFHLSSVIVPFAFHSPVIIPSLLVFVCYNPPSFLPFPSSPHLDPPTVFSFP